MHSKLVQSLCLIYPVNVCFCSYLSEPPLFKVKPTEYYVASLEEDVTMSCEGMGQPKPTILWKRVIASMTKLNFYINSITTVAIGTVPMVAQLKSMFLFNLE